MRTLGLELQVAVRGNSSGDFAVSVRPSTAAGDKTRGRLARKPVTV
jgi:hypothetical protein